MTILEIESEKSDAGHPVPGERRLASEPRKEGEKVAVGAARHRRHRRKPPVPPAAPAPKPAGERREPATSAPLLSPAARRAAAEEGVDPSKIAGTGRHGVILKEDIVTPPKPVSEPPPPAVSNQDKRVPMSAIRQRIAERLLTSQKATASLSTFNEADLSAVIDLRTRYKDKFKEKHGIGLGFSSFFVKAAVEALKAYPLVNSSIDGRDIVQHDGYHISVAVSTDKGLMVPVLRDADKLTFAQIEKAIAGLAVKARDGKISVADLQGGTFTITNGGIFGCLRATPILNYPQAAILGMHAIQKRPVVRDDQIVVRPMMYLALTYDHRLIDGRDAVLFLVRIKECIEDPERLLLEI